nr:reverse transcriptase domain-containing protein [Tanacetum cinerariifolium]
MFGQFMKINTTSSSSTGSLPSNTIPNPWEDLKVITTHSGVTLAEPSVSPSSSCKEVDREPETITDQVLTESTNNVPPLVVQPSPASTSFLIILFLRCRGDKGYGTTESENIQPLVAQKQNQIYKTVVAPTPKPTIPYPSRVNKQKLREKDDNLALKFVEIFRNLHFELSFTDALLHMSMFSLMFKSLLNNKEKLFYLATTSVNENCSAVILKKFPEKVGDPGKFLIPSDFLEFDECLALADLVESAPRLSATAKDEGTSSKPGVPDVPSDDSEEELSWNSSDDEDDDDNDEEEELAKNDEEDTETGKGGDEVSESDEEETRQDEEGSFDPIPRTPEGSEEESNDEEDQELRLSKEERIQEEEEADELYRNIKGEWRYLFPAEPQFITTCSYPTIKTSATLMYSNRKGGDFILEEIKACLTSESIPPGIDDSDLVLEGDIRLLEKLLNNDPSLSLLLPKELNVEEIKIVKSSIDEPLELELKELPSHLEYAYLEGTNKLPVIIAKDLKDDEKEALLKVSPNHCVPKKNGITLVENENNELILTRLVTGWRVCIDYRKLNDATHKDHFPLPFMDQMKRPLSPVLMEHFLIEECLLAKAMLLVDRAKVNVITKLPHPTSVKGVRSFLGHPGFYLRFIQDFSKIARPVTHLLENETPFVFSKDCINAFETLKKKLTEASILVVPDWNLPFELMCDASDFAIGAVLGQWKTKHFQPIHYASKTITEAQIHYSTTEKEMIGVVYAFQKFWPYLVLSKSIVYTNHSALKYLLNKQHAKLRLIRWVLLLKEFDIIICDKKGTENLTADHLSRLENPHKDVLENKGINENFPLETLGKISIESTP